MMLVDKLLAHPQSEARAGLFFGSEQRLEDARQRSGIDALAAISHRGSDTALTAVDASRCRDAYFDGALFVDCIKAVCHQVCNDVAQFPAHRHNFEITLVLLLDLGSFDPDLASKDVVADQAQYPVVGILNKRPANPARVDSFFRKCNVVVTTMQLASQCTLEVMQRMAELCPYLFIDEAHHVAAPTWKAFKEVFAKNRIIQFAAANGPRPSTP